MKIEQFSVKDYDFLHNNVPQTTFPQFTSLLESSGSSIKGFNEQSIRMLLTKGAHIIIVLRNDNSDIAAIGIFLPIKHKTGPYHEKRVALVHSELQSISRNLLESIDIVAKDVLTQTRWDDVTITESTQWNSFFEE